MNKYLKSYTAITRGTMAGRDDGYPYTEYHVYNSIEDVAKYYDTQPDEQYYEIHAVNKDDFKQKIQEVKQQIEAQTKAQELERKRQRLAQLKVELGEE